MKSSTGTQAIGRQSTRSGPVRSQRKLIPWLAVLAALSVFPALGNAIEAQECLQAWQDNNRARAWCSISDWNVTSSDKCELDLNCGNSYANEVTYVGSLNQVRNVRWCNNNSTGGGYLTTASC